LGIKIKKLATNALMEKELANELNKLMVIKKGNRLACFVADFQPALCK